MEDGAVVAWPALDGAGCWERAVPCEDVARCGEGGFWTAEA